MKTKTFYRVDYWPANNKGAGSLIGFFDELSDAMAEIPYNSRSEHISPEFDEHYTLTTYIGAADDSPEQAWEFADIDGEEYFNIIDEEYFNLP
jgi:hypothetical protein